MFMSPATLSTVEPWASLSHSLLKKSKFYLHPRLCYKVSYYLYLFYRLLLEILQALSK